jgi:hypothetical protein
VGAQTAADEDRLRSLQDLLEQVESIKGAQTGTVKAIGANAGQVLLQHDLTKVRQNYSKLTEAPLGELLTGFASDSAPTATTRAPFEYTNHHGYDSAVRIVSIKSLNSVAANAFTSGEKPVSLEVKNANLVARQVPGPESQLPVNVRVGEIIRQLKVGDASRFGNIDVTSLASNNNSSKLNREGPAYALRVQIMPAQ